MERRFDLAGKVALITDSSGSTAQQIAKAFLAAGSRVILCGQAKPSESAGTDLSDTRFQQLRDHSPAEIDALVDSVLDDQGSLDVLVCLAGWQAPIHDGLITPLHFSRAANRVMQAQSGGGCIINICSSVNDQLAADTGKTHAATAGLRNLCTSLAVEWAPMVRVNSVGLSLTQTEHSHAGGDTKSESATTTHPPSAIGETCLYLASPMAAYITGTHLMVAEK